MHCNCTPTRGVAFAVPTFSIGGGSSFDFFQAENTPHGKLETLMTSRPALSPIPRKPVDATRPS